MQIGIEWRHIDSTVECFVNKFLAALALVTLSATASAAAGPTVIFADNFDTNALSTNIVPNGWSVNAGTVDIIGFRNFYDLLPGNGKYVDLDGSTKDAGILSRDLSLLAGNQYTLTFDLAGNQRNATTDVVTIAFGTSQLVLNVAGNQSFALSSLSFSPSTSGLYRLSFSNAGGDNIGALLDRVQVVAAPVPEPDTYAMLVAGLGIVGLIARRRKSGSVR